MRTICNGVALSFGIEVDIDYRRRYPATVNSEAETALALKAATALVGKANVLPGLPPSMASEDFGFMLKKSPVVISGSAPVQPAIKPYIAQHTISMTIY